MTTRMNTTSISRMTFPRLLGAGAAAAVVRPAFSLPAGPVTHQGLAHSTGGGLVLNVPRMLPDLLQARISRARWPRAPIFEWLQEHGQLSDDEMHRVFNVGIGMVLAVAASDVQATVASMTEAGETAYEIGDVIVRPDGAPHAIVVA